MGPRISNNIQFFLSPMLALIIVLIIFYSFPFFEINISIRISLIFIYIILSINVYPELVSGFNIEYGRVIFALIFIAEYGRIIFIRIIFSIFFISNTTNRLRLYFFSTVLIRI